MSISGVSSSSSVDVSKMAPSVASKLDASESSSDSASSASTASTSGEVSSSSRITISTAGKEKSDSTSSASSTKIYEKKDTDEDGNVTTQEELLYDIKHGLSTADEKQQAVSSQNVGKNVDVNA